MFLTHALRAIFRAAVVTGDSLWKFVTLLISGTPPAVTFISDASTNGNVLTLNGDTRPSNFNPYTPGYYSNFFDGTGDYISVPDSTAFTMGAGDFTLEAWVYLTTSGVSRVIFGTCDAAGTQASMAYTLYVNASNNLLFGVGYSGTMYYSTNTATVPTNQWVHVAGVRNGANVYAYLNGVQSTTNTNMGSLSITDSSQIVGIGRNGAYNGEYLTGYISSARIVKGTAVYTAAFTPPTAPLTAIAGTSLLTCQSNRLIDNSLNNFVVTKGGDTTVSGFTPFTPPTSVTVNNLYSTYFDGTGDYLAAPVNAATQLGSNNFTIEFWLYVSTLPSVRNQVFYWNGNGSGYNALGIYITASNKIGINFSESGSSWRVEDITGVGAVTAGTWQHVAVVRNGQNIQIYQNGVAQGSAYTTTSAGTSLMTTYTMNHIGSYGTSSHPLTGSVSNFRLVNGTALYTSTFTPSTTPLTAIANTSLLTCQNATLIDNSTNAFAITSAGDARPVAQSPFTQTTTAVNTTYLGSGYFDGTGDYLTGPTSNAGLLMGTGDFTIEYWVYKTTSIAVATVVSFGGSGGNLRLFIDNATPTIWDGATSLGAGNAINLNSWNHIVAQRSGTTLRFYTNGISSATITNSSNFNAGTLGIGGGDANVITGYIADVRIVKGRALYTANFAPPAQPLTAVTNTQLLTLQTDQPVANKQFVDNSGNNFPITQVGNSTQGTFSPYGANWSNYFDGTGDYLSAASDAAFALPGNFTYECWFNSDNAGTTSQWAEVPVNNGLQIYYSGTQIFVSAYAVSALITYTYTMPVATWTHMAVVRNGTGSNNLVLYINGVSVATATTNVSFAQGAFRVGGASYIFKGYISNARLVKGTAVYTAAFTPPTAPLTAIAGTSLLTCQDNRFVDDSPNNFTLTRNGDVSVQRFSPFSPVIQTPTTYSTFFDGTGDYLTSPTGNATLNTALDILGGDYTVEFWMYKTADTNATIITNFTASGVNGWQINARESGGIQVDHWVSNTSTGRASTFSNYSINTWVHIAVVKLSGNYYFYVNGTEVGIFQGGTRAAPANGGAGTGLGIATYIQNLSYPAPFTGYLSNLRVVKGTAVYTANFTPSTIPLTAISGTSLLACQAATHIDNSANAFRLVQNGDAAPRQFNPFGFTNTTTGTAYTPALYAGSAYFDGTGDYLVTTSNSATAFGTGDFTIEGWFYFQGTIATYKRPWGFSDANDNIEIFSSVLRVGGGTQGTLITGATTLLPNTWYHIALTRASGIYKLWLNGKQEGSSATNSWNSAARQMGIAAYPTGVDPITGYISDLRVVKGTALYTGNFVPPLVPVTATTGTTLLLNMDKGVAVDSSRNNDLETVGDAKLRDETPYAGSYYSNYFDGTGDFLAASSSTFSTTGDLTLEGWAYVTSASNYAGIASMRDSTSGNGISLTILNTGYLEWSFGQAAGNFYQSTLCPLNQWFHIALVRSGSSTNNCSCYLNGTRVAQFTSNLEANGAANTFLIGRYYATGTSQYFLNGYVSNLRYVKGTALYSGTTYTVPTSPLTAISGTSLLTCQSKSFVDNSSNAFAITRNGDVAVKSQNPFQKNTYSSMYFDGTGDYLNIPTIPTAFVFGSSDFTIEFWTYFASSPAGTVWAGNFNNNSTALGVWTCYYYSVGEIAFFYGGSLYKVTYVLVPGQWYHVAFVRSGSSIKIFVNGAQVGTAGTMAGPITLANLQSGGWNVGRSNDAAAYLNGYMADLRITNSARTTGSTFPVPTAPLPTS